MDAFTAVADPVRRQVLDLLLSGERAAGELGEAFPDLSQPAMSRHLRVLREAGLIEARAVGPRRLYALRPEAFRELAGWVGRYQAFWGERLDAFALHLDAHFPADLPQEPAT